MIAVVAFAMTFIWLAREVDTIAQEKTVQQATLKIENLIKRNAILTEDYAYWTAAFNWFVAGDRASLYENIGSGAADSPSFDLIYLLHPDGKPAYAYISGVVGSDLRMFEPDLAAPLVNQLMAMPLTPYPKVSGIIAIDGEFVVLTAARIQPDNLGDLTAAELPMMVGGTWLNQQSLSDALFVSDIALVENAADIPRGRSTAPLIGPDGQTSGFISWPTLKPGRDLIMQAGPIVGFLALLLLSGSAVVGRTSAAQTNALLRERVSARTDPVTGLLNRKGIAQVTEQDSVAQAIRNGHSAVIYVDLNGLKALNDTYGHRVGDEAIRVTAERLAKAVRPTDYVARMGGDEFACLVIDDSPDRAAAEIKNRFEGMTSAYLDIGDRKIMALAAVGIAISRDSSTWETMLHQADAAMYADKLAKNGVLSHRSARISRLHAAS